MDNIMKNTKIELGMEELELVNGGWSIFDPVKKAVKSVAKWTYDSMIKPAGEWCYDNVIKPAGEGINDYVFEPLKECLEIKHEFESILTGKDN